MIDLLVYYSQESENSPEAELTEIAEEINKEWSKRSTLFSCLSVAAAGDNKKSNDKKPDIIVFKKVAKTVVHKCSVSVANGNIK